MSTYLIGYQTQKGEFDNAAGKTTSYNNRLLYFASDDYPYPQGFAGYICYSLKFKMSDIAKNLGVQAIDDIVDKNLKSLLRCQFKFVYDHSGGQVKLAGFQPVIK